MEFLLIFVGVYGLVVCPTFVLLAPGRWIQEEAIQKRLDAIATRAVGRRSRVRLLSTEEETFWEKITKFFLGENETAAQYTKFRRLLHQAGYPGERAVRIFCGMRIFFTVASAAGAFLFAVLSRAPVSNMVLLIVIGAALGYLLPHFFLRRRGNKRTLTIQETLPDTLDLLVICVEAGMGVDAALVRVAREQGEQGLEIGDELQLMSQEIQAGVPRREALSRLADRVGLEEIRGLVTFLTQTEELGGSIARSLRIYAATMRQKRSQKAEEAARKLVIKLIFPLILCIMPALFLVVLGPPGINIIKVLGGDFGR
jgi:tight adherence protein C